MGSVGYPSGRATASIAGTIIPIPQSRSPRPGAEVDAWRVSDGSVAAFSSTAMLAAVGAGAQAPQAPDGAELYKRSCAQCHETGVGRAPSREQFRAMSPDRVLTAMETGSMVTMANNRSAAERRAIAEFLTGQTFANALSTAPAPRAMCAGPRQAFDPGPRPGVERLGQRHVEQPVPDGRQGRAGRRRRAQAEAEMGVRLSWRSAVLLAGHRRRRTPVRRQLGRQGLLAERGDRLHPLVLRRG